MYLCYGNKRASKRWILVSAKTMKKTAPRLKVRAIIARVMVKADKMTLYCHLVRKCLRNRVQSFHQFDVMILTILNPVKTI